jgi:two-component system, sensor histidine kinase YesM
MRLLRAWGLDQTRGQIFIGFIATMTLVLVVTVGSIYMLLAGVQKRNALQYTDEIAVQTSGRLKSLLNEINVLTLQLAMDERIQDRLADELQGQTATYAERMKIRGLMQEKTVYSETIQEMELYSLEGSVYPIVDKSIQERVGAQLVNKADESFNAGMLQWLARDPEDPDYLLAIRQIKLERLDYAKAGYLAVKVKRSLIDFIGTDDAKMKGTRMYLLDENNEVIASENGNEPLPQERAKQDRYITVNRAIEGSDWSLEIHLPKKTVMGDTLFIQYVLLGASLGSVVLFAFLSYYLSRFITSPIKKLAGVMQQGTEGGLKENAELYFNREVNLLNRKYNRMVQEINHLIKSVYEIEIVKSKSEITALHSQINPHFLFNTLDSIYWAHVAKGEKELSRYIVLLADLFRYSIMNDDGSGLVRLEQEVDQVRRYIDLMKLRWQERLTVEFEIDTATLVCKIPKLTIQPLVENAIVHGIEPLDGGGAVHISARREGLFLVIEIRDNGIGICAEKLGEIQARLQKETRRELPLNGRGIGLFNVHKLVQLQYGEESGITIVSKPGEGTTVSLRLAWREEGVS